MPVARNGRETGDSVVADEVIDFTALDVRRAVIASAGAGVKSRVSRTRPRFGQARGKVLRVGAHVERSNRVAPDFPRRFRFLQPLQEPGFLFCSKNGSGRLIFAEIRDLGATVLIIAGGWPPL